MSPISIIGALIITLAMLSFGYGINSLQRFKLISRGVLWFLFVGIVLDILAIICMVPDISEVTFTIHGAVGLSALLVMVVAFAWAIHFYRTYDDETTISKPLFLYASIAYAWWVVAYFIGILLVILD